jgi:hypothetical protein
MAVAEESSGSEKRKSTSLYRSTPAPQDPVDEGTLGSLKGGTRELDGDESVLIGATLPALTSDAAKKTFHAQAVSKPEADNSPTKADKTGKGPNTSASRIALVRSRERFEESLHEEKHPIATTPPWVLDRLHRKRVVHHAEEALDFQDYGEDTILLRMAARHLLHLSLLTNNSKLIKSIHGAFARTMNPKKLPRLERQTGDPKSKED